MLHLTRMSCIDVREGVQVMCFAQYCDMLLKRTDVSKCLAHVGHAVVCLLHAAQRTETCPGH